MFPSLVRRRVTIPVMLNIVETLRDVAFACGGNLIAGASDDSSVMRSMQLQVKRGNAKPGEAEAASDLPFFDWSEPIEHASRNLNIAGEESTLIVPGHPPFSITRNVTDAIGSSRNDARKVVTPRRNASFSKMPEHGTDGCEKERAPQGPPRQIQGKRLVPVAGRSTGGPQDQGIACRTPILRWER